MACTVKSKESLELPVAAVTEKCLDQNYIESHTLSTQSIAPIQAEVYFQIED